MSNRKEGIMLSAEHLCDLLADRLDSLRETQETSPERRVWWDAARQVRRVQDELRNARRRDQETSE